MGTFCSKFYDLICNVFSYLQSPLLLIIRLFWGWGFFQAGLGKWQNIERTTQFFGSLDIPLPLFNAYLAGTIELVGGLMLLVGLWSRFPALLLTIVMFVAYCTAHHEAILKLWSDPAVFISESPFLFLYASLLVLAFGPGRFSIDGLWLKREN